ncbi:MAG: HMA2 domain-containing protein [Nitrospirota bacterium]
MVPRATISHASRGRLRIKVPSRKGDTAYFSALKEHFSSYLGIAEIEANPLTGSVLFVHALDARRIGEHGAQGNLFRLETLQEKTAVPLSGRVVSLFNKADSEVRKLTGNEIDTPAIAFLALLGLGIYQISRGNFAAPAWYTAFWYALNIVLKSLPGDGEGAA